MRAAKDRRMNRKAKYVFFISHLFRLHPSLFSPSGSDRAQIAATADVDVLGEQVVPRRVLGQDGQPQPFGLDLCAAEKAEPPGGSERSPIPSGRGTGSRRQRPLGCRGHDLDLAAVCRPAPRPPPGADPLCPAARSGAAVLKQTMPPMAIMPPSPCTRIRAFSLFQHADRPSRIAHRRNRAGRPDPCRHQAAASCPATSSNS